MTKTTLTIAVFVLILQICPSYGGPQVPCMFVFGDSLSDAGNNNPLASVAKANWPPYGIDFPKAVPTGRFCNGRTTVDLVGDHLGLPDYIKSFPATLPHEMSQGVNYASGSAGIRPETGFQVGQRISMDKQLVRHKGVVTKIGGPSKVNNCLYVVYVGSNDWMLNYYSGGPPRFKYTPNAYADALLVQLTGQLDILYNTGARKIAMFGMSPLGCLPTISVTGFCSQYINRKLQMYNDKLKILVDTLNKKYNDAQFIYINTLDIITPDLKGLGMEVNYIPCCGAFQVACTPVTVKCTDRNNHAYWDNAHPTEAANKVLAKRAYKSQKPTDGHPMDISSLANLKNVTQYKLSLL